jgi:hypothetical protein
MHQGVSVGVVGCGPVMGDGMEQLKAISTNPSHGKASISVAERASGHVNPIMVTHLGSRSAME